MMVRKKVQAVDEKLPTGLPYPVTPVALNGPSTEAAAFGPGNSNIPASTGVAHDDSIDAQNSNDVWGDLVDSKANNHLPNALRVADQKGSSMGATMKDGGLPPSLQVGTGVMTPRSSFDSQRSTDSASNSRQHIQASYPQTFPSNNPWASASGSPPRDVNAPPIRTNPESNGLSQPFAEPWFAFESSPAERMPPVSVASSHPLNQGEIPLGPFKNSFGSDRGPSDKRGVDPGVLKSSIYQGSELQELDGMSPWSTGDEPRVIPEPSPQSADSVPELPPRNIPPVKPLRPLLEIPLSPSETPRMGMEGEKSLSPERTSRIEQDMENSLAAGSKTSMTLNAETQNKLNAQRSETYQIRLVNWFDASPSSGIRSSPIMVQNANGPCPLLALVNALTLSTPANMNTPLLEILSVREQVSLGLLLDAVIDELMSGRRGDAAHNLPDVSDLYTFLINLHTGMNVNPSFISSEAGVTSLMDAPIVESPINPAEFGKPGGFEITREMKLYSTFGIPLIHGWIPPRNHVAYAALKRSAKTYEEAQNLMFREEELEDKLQRHGLNSDEQLMLEDVLNVKYFLSSSATQLTAHGLETMADALGPGSIAILFRNDHFSTLYKHPHSGQLFTLVTDMGYAGHDEVVWESLVDVNGEGCEFFAGDFRPVGNNTGPSSTNGHPSENSGWTTVTRSNGSNHNKSNKSQPSNDSLSADPSQHFSVLSVNDETPQSPSAEQEDHDLALALQLQEEEEDLHRRETAARRREENELSQAYLASETASPSSRRGAGRGRRQGQEIRPPVPTRGGAAQAPRKSDPDDGDEAPPPTYEQAANGPVYHPPLNHPTHPNTPGNSNNSANRPHVSTSRQSAYIQNSGVFGGSPSIHGGGVPTLAPSPVAGRQSRRRSLPVRQSGLGRGGAGVGGSGMMGQEDDDKRDCVVM